MPRTLTLNELSVAIGSKPTKSTLSRWASKGRLPCDRLPDGPRFDLAEVQSVIAGTARMPEASAPVLVPVETAPEALALLKILDEGAAPAIEMARAGLKLAGLELAASYRANRVTGTGLDSFKRALEELRRCEKEYLDIEEQRRNLIQMEDVKAMAGDMATRLNQAADQLVNTVPGQVEIWAADPAMRALDTEARRRRCREWLEEQIRSVRALLAADIDELLRRLRE